jgi:hypothetical protein
MTTEIRQAGTLGLNGIFFAVSEVGSAVLTVAVGTSKSLFAGHHPTVVVFIL